MVTYLAALYEVIRMDRLWRGRAADGQTDSWSNSLNAILLKLSNLSKIVKIVKIVKIFIMGEISSDLYRYHVGTF